MSKRIISILILLAMLLSACSEANDSQTETGTKTDQEIYDLPDDVVPAGSNSDDEMPESSDQTQSDGEISLDETQDITDPSATEEDEPSIENTEESENTQQSQAQSEAPTDPEPSESEPVASESTQPSETQEADVRQVDPAQLAALTLFALSMEYPDFVPHGFYSDNAAGKGIYAMFESGGENLTAHVYPIAEERTEPGTTDIYATEVGFAAFEIIEGADDDYDEIPEEAYVALLNSLTGVSVFSH